MIKGLLAGNFIRLRSDRANAHATEEMRSIFEVGTAINRRFYEALPEERVGTAANTKVCHNGRDFK